MCTVVYLPLPGKVIFSSNRDEDPRRKTALSPAFVPVDDTTILFPADKKAGGTWIALNANGNFLVLLNGGFTNHIRKEKYRKSRGLIVTEMIASPNLLLYWQQADLADIEPFTLVAFFGKKLHHFTWTGNEKFHAMPDAGKAHIWSSSTLYSEEASLQRRLVFEKYISSPGIQNKKALLHFLTNAMANDSSNGYVMNRHEIVKTCSISLVEISNTKGNFEYHDLLHAQIHSETMAFISSKIATEPVAAIV